MDDLLIKVYMEAFRNELGLGMKGLLDNAIRLGELHAILGDDDPKLDMLTEEEILKMIKQ